MTTRTLPHRSARTTNRQGGFTMMELLVSLTVTMIALAGLMRLYTTSARSNLIAQQSTAASDAAQQGIEELRGLSVTEIEALYAPITSTEWPTPIAFHAGDVVTKGITYMLDVSAREIGANTVRVRVQVQWSDQGLNVGTSPETDHRISLETLRGRTILW